MQIPGQGGVVRIGHRGAAGHAPENTLAAVRAGIALGADYVEVDVRRSHDGRLVVMHDALVDRTTNGSGLVAEMTWEQLRRLDAGGGQRVPSVEEVLKAASGRAGVMLEVKTPGLGLELLQSVQTTGFTGPVVYASFLHAEIAAIRAADPRAKTLALIDAVPVAGAAFARDAGASVVGLSEDCATPAFVAELHAAGLEVWVYTVNDPRLIRRVIAAGADGVISNFPERVPGS